MEGQPGVAHFWPPLWECPQCVGVESLALEGRSDFWKVLCSSLDDVSSKASMHFWSLGCTGYLLWAQGKEPCPTPKPCSGYKVATRFRGVSDTGPGFWEEGSFSAQTPSTPTKMNMVVISTFGCGAEKTYCRVLGR